MLPVSNSRKITDARALLDNAYFVEALAEVEQSIFELWKREGDKENREVLHAQVRALSSVGTAIRARAQEVVKK